MFINSFFSSGVVSFLEYLHVKMVIIELRKIRLPMAFVKNGPTFIFVLVIVFFLLNLLLLCLSGVALAAAWYILGTSSRLRLWRP